MGDATWAAVNGRRRGVVICVGLVEAVVGRLSKRGRPRRGGKAKALPLSALTVAA